MRLEMQVSRTRFDYFTAVDSAILCCSALRPEAIAVPRRCQVVRIRLGHACWPLPQHAASIVNALIWIPRSPFNPG